MTPRSERPDPHLVCAAIGDRTSVPSCRGTHRAGGYHQCVVRVRERSAPNAGSARALLM
jgi:hypothetical protein